MTKLPNVPVDAGKCTTYLSSAPLKEPDKASVKGSGLYGLADLIVSSEATKANSKLYLLVQQGDY